MAARIDRYWRVCATGFCFSIFGLGGLLLGVLVFPCLSLVVRQPLQRARLAKRVIGFMFRWFVELMRRVGVVSCEVHGAEHLLRYGLLIVANHPSLIDVVLLMSLIERADCIVKAALQRNPFTRGAVCSAGFICNDSGPGLIEECIVSLRSGNNLIVFPEGTRTALSGAPRLRRGAANIAVRSGIDLTPVHIRCSPPFLTKADRWYRVPARRAHFVIEVGQPIAVRPFLDACATEAIATRRLTDHLARYFFPEAARASA